MSQQDETLTALSGVVGRCLLFLIQLMGVSRELIRDLKKNVYLWLPITSVPYYKQESLFGLEVACVFSEANDEITLAGNCYATGSYTACVFHLMQIVEIGARSIIKDLKAEKYLINRGNRVPLELSEREWQIVNYRNGERVD